MQPRAELLQLIQTGRPDISEATANEWVKYLTQLTGCHLFSMSSPEIDKTQWLKDRCSGIGGSEIAAIMGKNSWSSPYQIWKSKLAGRQNTEALGFAEVPEEDPAGMDKEPTQSEAARWGNLLETIVATEWGVRTNRQWVHIPVILQDDEKPWLLANVDGFTLTDDRETIVGPLEIKTTSAYNEEAWRDGPIPEHYIYQTNWYCGITHLPIYDIVCLVGGQRLYYYQLPADPELFVQQKEAGEQFWVHNVLEGYEPVFSAADKELVSELHANATAQEAVPVIIDTDEFERLVTAYCDVRSKITALTNVHKAIHAQIGQYMGTALSAISQTRTVSFTPSTRQNCDFALLKRAYPAAYEQCVSNNTSYRINIK